MTKLTYTAHAEPGQGMTLGARVEIVKGWNAIVKRGDVVVKHGNLYGSKAAALREATSEAARFRAYRQQHGEGLEDVWAKQQAVKQAERRRWRRIGEKDRQAYDLLQAIASDAALVTEWLPAQAIARLEKVRELVAYVETDTKP